MSILIDLSQLAISNLMMSPGVKQGEIDSMLIRHMVLNSIRAYNKKFKREYGDVVICCDSKHYWRKDIFPYYKAHRKLQRSKSIIDWSEVFTYISEFKQELRDYFPYKVIEVFGAEADDIIAIITFNKKDDEKILIIGGDKDYAQLQSIPNVKQYAPKKKKFIEIDNPKEFLNELVIMGDKDDGIPNIRSDSDTFVKQNKRQSPIRKTEILQWKKCDDPIEFCETKNMLENYKRNKQLIDFSYIPEKYKKSILEEYKKESTGTKRTILEYFQKNRMRNLISDMDDF